jgi:hypothetical protein
MKVVSTWMYSTPVGDKVLHHQVGADSDLEKTQHIYWRCLFCFFESSFRLNRNVRHILFVNKTPPTEIDGIDLGRLIEAFRIEVVVLRHFTRPPKAHFPAWNTQFIVLDVIDWLADEVGPDDAVMVLDGDCLFHRPIGEDFLQALRKHGALLYSLDYPPHHKINGLTPQELAALSREYDVGQGQGAFVYCGGEFICAMGRELARISELARGTYQISLQRAALGLAKFREEAHLLSHVYRLLGYPTHSGNRYIKRIWTDRSVHCNVDGSEGDLTIWHLPAEKKRGFVKAFRSIREIDGVPRITIADLPEVFGIVPTAQRRLRDLIYGAVRPIYHGARRLFC